MKPPAIAERFVHVAEMSAWREVRELLVSVSQSSALPIIPPAKLALFSPLAAMVRLSHTASFAEMLLTCCSMPATAPTAPCERLFASRSRVPFTVTLLFSKSRESDVVSSEPL